jgi:hypothetical protein
LQALCFVQRPFCSAPPPHHLDAFVRSFHAFWKKHFVESH